ncbi:nuclease-related domain-containing protein [Robertmurraya massiliosenegalensis]|uniref:nuclease-related domain-containing protein n=1 Tax=Robertmurraya massiliosenegalensis TaxID=1287657 RepID=UPI001F38587B|nr:nuclease-related domain-containing protein [Robertmurraya massiliosenegalensis]
MKELSIPDKVLSLECLLRRLPETHPRYPEVQADYARFLKGYRGEKAVKYYLDFLSDKKYCLFHSLRLPSGKYHFQVDYLIITSRYALILECKNFFGTLFFDETFNQMIRTANEKEEGFQDPISQAKWHQQQLKNWLHSHHISLPIDYFVVISNPSTIVKTTPQNRQALKKVIHGHSLLNKIAEMDQMYRTEILDSRGMRKINKQLMRSHVEEKFDALGKYSLKTNQILTGVQCPECGQIPMIRHRGKWFCSSCGVKDKNAHASAVQDYFHLVNETITNKQFRDFVHLESEDTAKRLLNAINLPTIGTNKGRKYLKPRG